MRAIASLLFGASVLVASCDTLKSTVGNVNLPVTETEAADGLRQALDKGIDRGVSVLHVKDGFFGNAAYKILMPTEAQRIEKTLRDLGMGGMVDRAVLQINRAAEEAVASARPIFVDALRGMTITDALAIVRGGDTSATQYFRDRTTNALVNAFTPIVKSHLDQLNATKYYSEVIDVYNGFPTTREKLNPDLVGFVTGRAINALFDQVAKEEINIRNNAAARTTELLKRVFGRAGRS